MAILKSRFGDPQVSRHLQRFEVHAEHFGPILIAVLMKNLPSGLRLQVSRNMPQGKWEISKLLDEFEKEFLSREGINILNSDNANPDPPVLPCICKPIKGSQKQIRFNVLIVNKTTQAINVQLLPMSKLENKFY